MYEMGWITRIHNTIIYMKLTSVYISHPLSLLFSKLDVKHNFNLATLVLQILYTNMHTSINYIYPCLLSYWLNFSLLTFTLRFYLVSFMHNLANFFSILAGTRLKNFLLVSHFLMPLFHYSIA